jgi:hypothetical protein
MVGWDVTATRPHRPEWGLASFNFDIGHPDATGFAVSPTLPTASIDRIAELISHRNSACIQRRRAEGMAAKLAEGDTVAMTGEVTRVHNDGTVTVRLHGLGYPVTIGSEHLSLVAKRKAEPGRRKLLFDKPD